MAVAQVLIYSGAIVVLFLIVVALLPTGGSETLNPARRFGAALVVGCFGAALAGMLLSTSGLGAIAGEAPDVKQVGKPLFSDLLVPFELTAPLLLAAIVSAIALWKRQERAAARAGGAS
jgi:NADH-quinone oxidoreductase subunit J